MMKNRKSFLAHIMAGALGAALLCGGAPIATAQGYNGSEDNTYVPHESVIIHPNPLDYGRIETHQLVGRVDGQIDPTMLTITAPVSYSDLDLSRASDVSELRLRVRDTAIDLCSQLASRDINMGDVEGANRECVSRAIQNAMAQIPNRDPLG